MNSHEFNATFNVSKFAKSKKVLLFVIGRRYTWMATAIRCKPTVPMEWKSPATRAIAFTEACDLSASGDLLESIY